MAAVAAELGAAEERLARLETAFQADFDEELTALRETNHRQHKLFKQTLVRTRDTLQDSFNTFAAETQKAYQQLRTMTL